MGDLRIVNLEPWPVRATEIKQKRHATPRVNRAAEGNWQSPNVLNFYHIS